MTGERKLLKKGMIINIPSDLRRIAIDELEEEMDSYLKTWNVHVTPLYRMVLKDQERLIRISRLQDIAIFDQPDYIYREFKNILHLFSKGLWLATVSTAGAICEYLTQVYYPKKYNLRNFMVEGQMDRIKALSGYIGKKEKQMLVKINQIRNKCLHLDIIGINELEVNATDITNLLIELMEIVSTKYFKT